MSDYRDKTGYGIKREIQIPRGKNEVCKDCKKGILFRFYDYKLDCIVTRCQNCTIKRLDKDKTLYPNIRTAQEMKEDL